MIEGRPRESLVMYDNPVEVSKHDAPPRPTDFVLIVCFINYRFPEASTHTDRRVSVSNQADG